MFFEHILSMIFNGEEIFWTFDKKWLRKTNLKQFRSEKVMKTKGDALYVRWKGYDNSFNSWVDKQNTLYKWVNIFQKPKSLVTNGKVELNWSNYATKADLKNSTGVDTLDFAKKNWFC